MTFEVLIEDRALRYLGKLEPKAKERIIKALPKLSELFRVRINVVKLAGFATNIAAESVITEFCLKWRGTKSKFLTCSIERKDIRSVYNFILRP